MTSIAIVTLATTICHDKPEGGSNDKHCYCQTLATTICHDEPEGRRVLQICIIKQQQVLRLLRSVKNAELAMTSIPFINRSQQQSVITSPKGEGISKYPQ
jgi:hypothetical protein